MEKKKTVKNMVIAVRIDSSLLEKINLLEKIRNKSKSEVIKEAVAKSFNHTLFASIHEKIYNFLKKIFGDIHLKIFGVQSIGNKEKKNENKRNFNPFIENPLEEEVADSSQAYYKINFPRYENKSKSLYFCLNQLIIWITIKPSDIIQIKFVIDGIISGKMQEIDSEILKKITQIITKEGFKLEASGTDQIKYSLIFERNANRFEYKEWGPKFEKDLVKIKSILAEISKLLSKETKLIKINNKKGDLSADH